MSLLSKLFTKKSSDKKEGREEIFPPPSGSPIIETTTQDNGSREEAESFPPPSGDPVIEVETTTQDGGSEKKWTGFHSPEEEYLVMPRQGDKEELLIELNDGDAWIHTKERRDVDAPEPCGFRFRNVIVSTKDTIDTETGELINHQSDIIPDINSFAKMAKDWKDLDFFLEAAGKQIPQFPMGKAFLYINNLKYLPSRKIEDLTYNPFCDHDYDARITVEPLTKTGKAKKFPISTWIEVSWEEPFDEWFGKKEEAESERIYLISHYLKDGRIGKGRINLDINHQHYEMEFALDTKSETYYIK